MDADGWRRILYSNSFDDKNIDLKKTLVNFVKKNYTPEVSTRSIEAFVVYQLFLLYKNLGLRPVEIGEILRKITGKVIVPVPKKEVE